MNASAAGNAMVRRAKMRAPRCHILDTAAVATGLRIGPGGQEPK